MGGGGRKASILKLLKDFSERNGPTLYLDKSSFMVALLEVASTTGVRLSSHERKAILTALGERDQTANVNTNRNGNLEPDPILRETEIIPLKEDIESYFRREILPYAEDAWIDDDKTKVGYEIPLNRNFYQYEPPRAIEDIQADIKTLGADLLELLSAVTGDKGSSARNSYPELKYSGVEWLGLVPDHWQIKSVKKHYDIQLGKMLQSSPSDPTDIEVPYLKAQHVQWFKIQTTNPPSMWASHSEIDQFEIQPGDLLVCEGGEGGRCGMLTDIVDGCIIQNALHRVRPREGTRTCINEFLQYSLSAIAEAGWLEAIHNKATIAHFTKEKFGSLKVQIPPLSEQEAIVKFLDLETSTLDRLISKSQSIIDRLKEYRTALVTAVVTGKRDVRGVTLRSADGDHDDS